LASGSSKNSVKVMTLTGDRTIFVHLDSNLILLYINYSTAQRLHSSTQPTIKDLDRSIL
jgi:hypothetical protein